MKRQPKTYFGFFPCPLSSKVVRALMPWAHAQVSALAGEGALLPCVEEGVSMYMLPQEYEGVTYLIRYSYTRENGTQVEQISAGVK